MRTSNRPLTPDVKGGRCLVSYCNKWVSVRTGEVGGSPTGHLARAHAARPPEKGGAATPSPPGSLLPQGRQLESVRAEAAEKGDVGLVAENSRSTQRLMLPPPALTASGVFAKFRDIARLTGSAVSGAGCLPPSPDPLLLTSGTQNHVWQEGKSVRLSGVGSLPFCPGCGPAIPPSHPQD